MSTPNKNKHSDKSSGDNSDCFVDETTHLTAENGSGSSKFQSHSGHTSDQDSKDAHIHVKGGDANQNPLIEDDDQVSPTETAYERAYTINVIHYWYALKHACKLRKKKDEPLKLEDLPLLGKTEEVSHKIIELEAAYNKYKANHEEPSLFWPILRVFWRRCFKEQFIVILYCAAKILFTLFLSQILENVQAGNKEAAYHWAYYLFAATIIGVYTHHFSFFQGYKMVTQLRPALIGMIYRKINRLSYFSINQVSIGKIVNIAANDLNILEFQTFFVFYLVISPLVLGASLAILWSLVGPACLTGIAFIFLNWPIQYYLSQLGGKYVGQKNPITDERVKLTNEMIEGIRLLKMYGWEQQYAESIAKTRTKEVALLTKLGYCDYFGGHMLARLAPAFGSFIIFLTYYYMGGTLTASKVYSTIIMLSFLRSATVLYSSTSLRFIAEIRLTFKRIIQLLEVAELDHNKRSEINRPVDPRNGVEFENFYAYWGEKKATEPGVPETLTFENPTLKNINFTVKRGTLCAIVGRIGCGKSTALMSFFDEVPKTTGSLKYAGRLAYVEQETVIYPGTLRSNILFGRPYDERKYKKIVEACCMLDDFKEFPCGDLTEIGEKGVNLSGGQKARTSLARALYSDADVYLLDDPLSAVDTKVAKNLFAKAIRGVLRDKTVILATHQVHFAREAEKVVVLDNGQVKAEGTIDEIIRQDASIMSIFETRNRKASADVTGEQRKSQGERSSHGSRSSQGSQSYRSIVADDEASDEEPLIKKIDAASDAQKEEKGKLISQEKDESSEVGWSTYWYYLKHAGSFWYVLFFVINLVSIELLYVSYNRLLGYWTEGTWTADFTLKILGFIIIAFVLALALREVLFVNFGINASRTLHNKILHRVMNAVIEFFDTNPSGRILNRFSNDVGVLDRFLLQVQNEVIDALFYFSAILATVCVILPWLVLPACALITIILLLVQLLKKFIIQGRGLELLTRSPIYSLFSLTLSGLVSIRVYSQENRFIRDFTHLLNRNARAFSFYYDTVRVFAFWCDFSAGIFACVGIALLLYMDTLDPALMGLTCCYLLSVTDHVQFAMRQTLTHIMQMASTERLKTYTAIPQEAALTLPTDEVLTHNKAWPSQGQVEFNNVYMKYRKNTEHVLKGLTFTAQSAEKIGCVGRTGAGKSSIIQALFRMVEVDKQAVPDSCIRIDGVDTGIIGLHTIRKNISIIPQTPFIFMGTVRKNLDPLKEHSDEAIISALQETNLWDYIKTLPNGLDTDMSNASSVFSVGQKQLICLARTLLQNNKILVLDEATANVDFETDNFIQSKIMDKFKDSTIFTIAHRLSTVANYDRVLVMSKGRAIELDHPYKLLVKEIGDDKITRTDGVFASMVLNTGAKHSAVIFEIAKKSYYDKQTPQ